MLCGVKLSDLRFHELLQLAWLHCAHTSICFTLCMHGAASDEQFLLMRLQSRSSNYALYTDKDTGATQAGHRAQYNF